jgi:hypothetical protein
MGAAATLALGLAACSSDSGRGQATLDASAADAPSPPVQRTGCAGTTALPAAPGGYTVNGNTICTADGRPHLLHGVDRPSLEWSTAGENLSREDFRLMASWNANVVRVALNQDFWITGSPSCDPSYASGIDDVISWAEAAGLDVILDLHWSDAGVLGGCSGASGCQQRMADENSLWFWRDVAARYKNDGRVMFELYNEPHDVSWEIWRSGGEIAADATSPGFQVVGMQQLYDAVRATGANNLVIIGGLDWAYDLSGVPAHRIEGANIVYATHPYNTPGRRPYDWDASWGFLTATDPVIVTEFGGLQDATCGTDYSAALIEYADAHAVSWTAWAWYPGGCKFPALIDDWWATPSPTGAVVKAALLSYGDPPASSPGGIGPGGPPGSPADGGATDFSYTFDRDSEGWVLNSWDNPDLANLGARVPDGGTRPTLRFTDTHGDPNPGALELTVAFTTFDQYAVADIATRPGLNLSGKTIAARVRLAAGLFSAGDVKMYACSDGPTSYVCVATPPLDASSLAGDAWLPVTLDLAATTAAGFDVTKILEIGIAFSSPRTTIGVLFAGAGDTVFEIDTVTAAGG